MIELLGPLLKISLFLLPLIYDKFFSPERKVANNNEAFDKAIADNDTAELSRLLSERVDRVRSKGAGGA